MLTPAETPKSEGNAPVGGTGNINDTVAQERSAMMYSTTAKGNKPPKPRPDFPLFAHANAPLAGLVCLAAVEITAVPV
jgi:hypothetical protein